MKRFFTHMPLVLLLSIAGTQVSAQNTDAALSAEILQRDSLFWHYYNTCQTDSAGQFFTADVEFYHDKGGITLGGDALAASFKNNLCNANNDWRLRREAIAGTVKVFPLRGEGKIYGAILSGDHVFYVLTKGNPERLDGQAKFTHLWILENGKWQMKRVLSYDHGPASYINKRQAVELSPAVLKRYEGKYEGSENRELEFKALDGALQMTAGGKDFVIYPEKEGLFFSKERDLTFEFIRKGSDKKMLVRENGVMVEETTLQR